MKTRDLMIRCVALREGDHWVGICLPFDLAAQAATPQEVRAKLDEQIRDYLVDALAGEDREHADYLLERRAPARYWLLYWLLPTLNKFHQMRSMMKFKMSVPMVPAAC